MNAARAQAASLPEGFRVETPAFSGTLGELAQALRSAELRPQDLDLYQLVKAYLAYFHALAERDLDLASEGLPGVARVIELKLRLLLPRPPREPEEEAALVEEALEAVTLLEDLESAISFLRQRREARRIVLPARAPRPDYPRPARPLAVGVDRLQQLAARYRLSAYFELALERFSMADAMRSLLKRLKKLRRGRLAELTEHGSWSALSVTFAGMLELYKEGKLRAEQHEPFGPIELELAEAAGRVEAA